MTASLHDRIRAAAPDLRGRLLADQPLADLTWFRVGGPAEVLFTPADEEDLARLLATLDPDVPVTVIGLGSNLIVRDGRRVWIRRATLDAWLASREAAAAGGR